MGAAGAPTNAKAGHGRIKGGPQHRMKVRGDGRSSMPVITATKPGKSMSHEDGAPPLVFSAFQRELLVRLVLCGRTREVPGLSVATGSFDLNS